MKYNLINLSTLYFIFWVRTVVATGTFHVVGNTEVIQVLGRYFQSSKSVSTFILVDTTQHPKVTCLPRLTTHYGGGLTGSQRPSFFKMY